MFITVKDIKPENIQGTSANIIDQLFNGVDVDINEQTPFTYSKLVRYKTYNVNTDEVLTNKVTVGMMQTFYYNLKRIYERHPNPSSEYTTFKIPKKTHGFREINAPLPALKEDMKNVAKALQDFLMMLPHDSAWAYTEGRDVVHAMKEHTSNKSKWYLKIDLHDFCGSCSKDFIINQLNQLYPFAYYKDVQFTLANVNETLNMLANFATLDDGLPQGTPLSPILTNLIMIPFDYAINKMLYNLTKEDSLLKQKYIYTRYADDIIISAKNKFDYNIILNALKDLFKDTPLTINEEKTRFGSNAGRNWNLGIMCNKDDRTTIGYRRKQQLKAIINNYAQDRKHNNLWSIEDLYWLQGQLSWLQNVEPDYYKGFCSYLTTKYDMNIPSAIKEDIKKHNN